MRNRAPTWPWLHLLLGVVLAFTGGCGGAASGPGSPGDPVEEGSEEGATSEDPPVLDFSLEVIQETSVTTYSDDMIRFTVKVRTDREWDLWVPGPPHLKLRFFDLEDGEDAGEEIVPRPNPLRPRPKRRFPLSLEAGEAVEAVGMPLGYFDIDPRHIAPDRKYRIEIRYDPGDGAPPVLGKKEVVLLPGRYLDFPTQPWTEAGFPDERESVPVRILDARARLRRYLEWSPDVGLVPTG